MVSYLIDTGFAEDSNIYLMTGAENILIDTGTGLTSSVLISNIREIVGDAGIQKVILTHCHIDHIGGLPAICREFHPECFAAMPDSDAIRNADAAVTVAGMYGISLPPMEVSDTADGDIFDNGDHRLRVVSTPGHTKGSICLFDENSRDLYSGDTVFLSGVGRMDLPSGSYDDMRSSLDRISKLNIIGLFPGHGGTSREYGPDYVRRAARIVSI